MYWVVLCGYTVSMLCWVIVWKVHYVVGQCVVGHSVVGHCVVGNSVVGHSVVGHSVVGHCVVGHCVVVTVHRVVGDCVVGDCVVGHCVVGAQCGGYAVVVNVPNPAPDNSNRWLWDENETSRTKCKNASPILGYFCKKIQ